MSFITTFGAIQNIPTDGIGGYVGDSASNKVSGTSDKGAMDIVTTGLNLLSYAIGLVAVVMLIVGGIKYATSTGDEKKVTSAKHTVLYALIGLGIAVLAWTLSNFVFKNLGGQ